jgi:hypothetical protein
MEIKLLKRAQLSTLQVIIIALAVGLILIFASIAWSSYIKNRSDIEACHLSVLGKSYSKPGGKSPLEMHCPRNYITFFENKIVSRTGTKETKNKVVVKGIKTDKFKELTQDIVFQTIAQEAKDCWYKMGEGKYVPFDQNFFIQTTACMLCSSIEFEPSMKEKPVDYKGISLYLNETVIPGTEQTYAEYLQSPVFQRQRVPWVFIPFVVNVVKVGDTYDVTTSDTISTSGTYYLGYQAFNPTTVKWNFVDFFTLLFKGQVRDEVYGILFLINADNMSAINCGMLYN